jgi:hypothetical protein
VRVNAQLIECQDQTVLWSARRDHDLAEVFRLQDAVAAAVAGASDGVPRAVERGREAPLTASVAWDEGSYRRADEANAVSRATYRG